MKSVRMLAFSAVCILALGGLAVLHGDNGFAGATYLTTITNASDGSFSSRSVIALHADHSLTAIDSGQGGPGVQFSSQQGAWTSGSGNNGVVIVARTLDFSFPSAGIARVDYTFTTVNADQAAGTITLTVFGLQDDPLDGGGTVVGTFNFTGTRVGP